MLYKPRMKNGKEVKLSWNLSLYRICNHICWPLREDATKMEHFVERTLFLAGIFMFFQHNDAELRYLRKMSNNLDVLITGLPTYLILVEITIRFIQLGMRKNKFRKFLERFYTEFYVDKLEHPKHFKRIQKKLRPTWALSVLYLCALLSFLMVPILNVVHKRKDFLYKMIYPFETPTYLYVILVISNAWTGLMVDTMVFGEASLIAEIGIHVDARYHLLSEEFERRVDNLLTADSISAITDGYQRLLIHVLERNLQLNQFLADVQKEFSFRIFVIFAFSATLLCTVAFIVYTNPISSAGFIAWACAKICEMLAFGEIGSTLLNTTNKMSSMYYNSKWELIIAKSSDAKENARLMKLVAMSIELNQKAFHWKGLNFFGVTLNSVIKILQGGASYFTCLISFR